jgi:hypothetical protein
MSHRKPKMKTVDRKLNRKTKENEKRTQQRRGKEMGNKTKVVSV